MSRISSGCLRWRCWEMQISAPRSFISSTIQLLSNALSASKASKRSCGSAAPREPCQAVAWQHRDTSPARTMRLAPSKLMTSMRLPSGSSLILRSEALSHPRARTCLGLASRRPAGARCRAESGHRARREWRGETRVAARHQLEGLGPADVIRLSCRPIISSQCSRLYLLEQ